MIVETWEPVYEEDDFKTLENIGTKNATLHVYKDGTVRIEGKKEILNVELIKKWYDSLNVIERIGDFDILIPSNIKAFRVGCEDENNLVSRNEIVKVIDAFNEL